MASPARRSSRLQNQRKAQIRPRLLSLPAELCELIYNAVCTEFNGMQIDTLFLVSTQIRDEVRHHVLREHDFAFPHVTCSGDLNLSYKDLLGLARRYRSLTARYTPTVHQPEPDASGAMAWARIYEMCSSMRNYVMDRADVCKGKFLAERDSRDPIDKLAVELQPSRRYREEGESQGAEADVAAADALGEMGKRR